MVQDVPSIKNSVNDASAIVWLCKPIVCFSILCGGDLAWLYFHISCHDTWFSMSCQKSSHPRSKPYSTIIKWLLKRYKESIWGSWIYISCNFCMISPFPSYFYIYRAVWSTRYAKMWRMQWLSEPCWWIHLWYLQVLPGFKQTGRACQVNKLNVIANV